MKQVGLRQSEGLAPGCSAPSVDRRQAGCTARTGPTADGAGGGKPFNLLRWFSVASLAVLVPVAAITGSLLTHHITEQTLQRDASLTAQFIQDCVEVEAVEVGLGRSADIARFLDPREDPTKAGVTEGLMSVLRERVNEHLERLPDVLLTTLYAPDGLVVWSSNKSLIGQSFPENEELQEAFQTRVEVARHHSDNLPVRGEQRFVVQPQAFFIENYVPLSDHQGKVVMVAEVYKEPRHLMREIRQGQILVWTTTLTGGVALYLGLFSIVRRASALLKAQQEQLVENESLVHVGEMSLALAHTLRNPLARVRSSAELTLASDDDSVRRNALDIMSQVDFLAGWIRDLLLYSRPLAEERESVDARAVLRSVLASFVPAFDKTGIRVTWRQEDAAAALVRGNTSLFTQVFHSVISNAVEAMPRGGELHLRLQSETTPPGLTVEITDTGAGMSPQQLKNAFKPFHSTKANGLGVGVPMVKRAMERFGGSVTLSSAESVGTSVRLFFRT